MATPSWEGGTELPKVGACGATGLGLLPSVVLQCTGCVSDCLSAYLLLPLESRLCVCTFAFPGT